MSEAFDQEIGADGYGEYTVLGLEVVMKLLASRLPR